MSRENVEIVRRIMASWAQGDFSSEAGRFDPEVKYETVMPDSGQNVVAHGFSEMEAFTRDWLSQWQRYRIVGEEFLDVGPTKVFVSVRQVATGEQSGAEVESHGFTVWTLRAQNVVKLSLHYDKVEALKAAGLSE